MAARGGRGAERRQGVSRHAVDGRIVSVNVAAKKGVRKEPVESITLVVEHGVEGDAHAGPWHRQVSLLANESIEKMKPACPTVDPGAFGENITTEGIVVHELPVGARLYAGETLLEVTQIGKVCHDRCAIFHQAGDCVMPREGVFAVVREAGDVAVGDAVKVVSRGDGTCARSPHDSLAESESVRAANECRKLEKEAEAR